MRSTRKIDRARASPSRRITSVPSATPTVAASAPSATRCRLAERCQNSPCRCRRGRRTDRRSAPRCPSARRRRQRRARLRAQELHQQDQREHDQRRDDARRRGGCARAAGRPVACGAASRAEAPGRSQLPAARLRSPSLAACSSARRSVREFVAAGPDPAIHVLAFLTKADARDKPAHDGAGWHVHRIHPIRKVRIAWLFGASDFPIEDLAVEEGLLPREVDAGI